MVRFNSAVISALICSFVLYLGFVPVRNTGCKSLVSFKDISFAKGSLDSSPVKHSYDEFYSGVISVCSVSGSVSCNNITSSSKGRLSVLIPAVLVEYSENSFFEQGELLCCKGFWNDKKQCFQITSAESVGFSGIFGGRLNRLRAVCRVSFKRQLKSWGNAGGLIISLLTGSRDYISVDTGNAFRNAGLSHILALSGLHLSFMAGLTGFVCTKLFGKKYILLARLLGIFAFVWFAGFSPSLYRAFLFSLIVIGLSFFKCRVENDCLINILAVVFLIHIVVRPYDMFNVAFMLSYTALAGILFASNFFLKYSIRFLPPAIAGSISASTSAQIATAPVCLHVFGTFSPIGIIATVFVSPLISVFLSISVLGIILSCLLPFLSPAFSCILNIIYSVIIFFVRFFARG